MSSKKHQPPSQRGLKVSEEIRRVLSSVFRESIFWEEGLEAVSLAITEVRISPDLRNARVFILPLSGSKVKASLIKDLTKATPKIRKALGQKLQLRLVPDLTFQIDNAFENFSQIDSLLNNPKVLKDIEKPDTE
ncbi:MAG: ribosome-binding factor A [Alphaproteobacteria bacterium RIFCSPLOWO2_01_FULL_45_8]|nr:MAG: ribosome-binding factor A [Alphaproteobacteria bacterium GWB1_45_5]OFW76269.1 MAG: ribosome-binding factor A [Alphaproteobacteria bacterium GWA1_45_9]OFW89459.1 MAG: ribosome-binding factor A [Alphaproteobacteria bacterium RIFCSPHIGHO2_01_FULL_41_14]OFW96607.1 MAG: ribosome-binding factor A [Alphaproteobacteria bacterium RIFCSPLOWO2_01_FULL_45_8]HCI48639.1 30S ribosome-binding factor RbfA [Holosporales bacterium]